VVFAARSGAKTYKRDRLLAKTEPKPPSGPNVLGCVNRPVETVGKVRFRGFTRNIFCDKSEAMFRNSL
jgi:hypothetical protein